MCKYCEENKKLKSSNFCGSAEFQILGNYLDIFGDEKKFNIFKRIYRPSFLIHYCPICRKEVIMNIDNNKPVNNILKYTIIFYEEETKPNTWGSNNVEYELYYNSKDGIMQVNEIGAFGDSTLVAMYRDRRNRGITLKEMLENIEEISNMTYKEFKEKILKM